MRIQNHWLNSRIYINLNKKQPNKARRSFIRCIKAPAANRVFLPQVPQLIIELAIESRRMHHLLLLVEIGRRRNMGRSGAQTDENPQFLYSCGICNRPRGPQWMSGGLRHCCDVAEKSSFRNSLVPLVKRGCKCVRLRIVSGTVIFAASYKGWVRCQHSHLYIPKIYVRSSFSWPADSESSQV